MVGLGTLDEGNLCVDRGARRGTAILEDTPRYVFQNELARNLIKRCQVLSAWMLYLGRPRHVGLSGGRSRSSFVGYCVFPTLRKKIVVLN